MSHEDCHQVTKSGRWHPGGDDKQEEYYEGSEHTEVVKGAGKAEKNPHTEKEKEAAPAHHQQLYKESQALKLTQMPYLAKQTCQRKTKDK